ncbi:MAG: hypothetical protein B7Y37_07555 [Sphingobacteriia bacterium 28-36-52]|nr:MAG: hypothetical protein B7Y37_07555 [Sphingobacteriia bacterium 28-36-52]
MQENYHPNRREQFLWWLSTAETELLKDAVVDRNRHSIIGMLVLGTWGFATLAWSYFFSTVVSAWWLAVILGIFMGGLILFIDRALIKGVQKSISIAWKPLVFRLFLAITIGLFMAQPALLFLFEKEVKVQASIDNEIRKKNKNTALVKSYQLDKEQFITQQKQANEKINRYYQEMINTRNRFIEETDGTGGSKKIGLKAIALAKKAAAEKAATDYQAMTEKLIITIQYSDSAIQSINSIIAKEQASFNQLLNNGFITQIEALDHLIQQNRAVAFRYYLLIVLLLLIEIMPLLAKYLLPSGTYEVKSKLVEAEEIKLIKASYS